MRRWRASFKSLRVRVLVTTMAVFAISLAVASFLAYQLLLQDGGRDVDIVLEREQERFHRSMSELLVEAREDDPQASSLESLRAAVRRYLELNPSTESYWTIITFEDGRRLAAANGPSELTPLFRGVDGAELPEGPLNERVTLPSSAGDVRTTSVPVLIDDQQFARLQIIAPLSPVRAEALEAALSVLAAAGIALLVGGSLLGVTLWRSLEPLGALAQAARSTELQSLAIRVEEPETEDEVGVLAREFNSMLDRLDRAAAQQREFMASVGHELRTPITIARGHLELLARLDRGDVAYGETLSILEDELRRMSRLVDDLMAIARAEMEDFIRPREVELVQWFEEMELRIASITSSRRVTVLPPPPVMVTVDPDRLGQAVLNLVVNAVVHTPDGTSIRVEAEVIDDRVVVSVIDDGPGIPESVRDEVFTAFVRAGEAPGSTGLGLAVVKAVMDAHGGEVSFDSSPHGTRFELAIPFAGQGPDATNDVAVHDTDVDTLELEWEVPGTSQDPRDG